MTCQARQHSDQMICAACGLVWDTNDPEPPSCKQDGPQLQEINGCIEVYSGPKPKAWE
jgi:hypothetical protein